ncbi:MAG: hypothetical protein EZS28_010175 [Streblomastix strix]|uniref:Protein kinase domain-containing protein n=1 Tax=Streblomastix strix TaxID=222440 RepID=A0A5J4WIW1_9EUKA|nr:MAG: hypothetical protein EZS28_010175 [Streblomastix strix]
MEELQLLIENNIEPLQTLEQTANGRVYLAYHGEYGITVAKVMWLEKFDQREWDAAMEGMKTAHGAGLIHRDIRADNIMMHSINGSTKVQIADFGMTIITGEGEVGLVKNKNILYVAPELVIDTQIGTNKMDMWSIGVVLYQLATHEFPINANGLSDLQNKMRSRRIDRPVSIKDDLQWDLLIKLLEFDPNKRFSAAEALQHPYFTSPQVDLEISIEARRIASNAAASIEEGQNKVTLYDLDSAFIVATTEISVQK